MENDQYVRVKKNGYEGKLHITTWNRIGMENNAEGWILIPSEPSEVTEIREKKIANQVQRQAAQEQSYQNGAATAEKNEIAPVKEEEIVKTKRKYTKKEK